MTGVTDTSLPVYSRLSKLLRLTIHATAALWLLMALTSNTARALDDIELSLGSLSGPDWQVDNARIQLALSDTDAVQYKLSSDSIQHPALPFTLKSPVLTCAEGTLSSNQISCQKGQLEINHQWLKKRAIPVRFSWSDETGEFLFSSHNIPMKLGSVSIETALRGANWKARVRTKRLDMEKMLNTVSGLLPTGWNDGMEFSAIVSADIRLQGTSSTLKRIKWSTDFQEVGFSDSEGLYIAEQLTGRWTGSANNRGKSWKGSQKISLKSGAALTPYFYLEPETKPVVFSLDYAYNDEKKSVFVPEFRLEDPGTFSVSGDAQYQLQATPDGGGVEALSLVSREINIPRLYSRYLQPVLSESVLETLELAGSMDLEIRMDDYRLVQVKSDLNNIYVEHQGTEEFDGSESPGLFALYNLDGDLNWQAGEQSKISSISWDGGHMLGSIAIGATTLPLKIQGKGIELTSESRIPLFDGALNAELLSLEMNESGPKVAFQGYLTPISLEAFSQALGWPILSGQISGMVPGITFEEGTLAVDGMALFKVFDGDVVIKDLVLEDIFSALPAMSADITLKNLDLEALTRTFSFGKITGKLDGRVESLRLEDWQPISFDARFATPDNDDSRHRINQKAVDNISNLGGAGVSGALSRSFLRFFEEFSYDRLGISCRLENGVCRMGGIEPADRGYYLVKGGGLPRIDIVGFNQSTDWHVLISKLKQISEGGAPVIE